MLRRTILSVTAILALSVLLLSYGVMSETAEAKKKKTYKVQVNFNHACSCTKDVTIRIFDGDGDVIVKKKISISKLALQQDEEDVNGPIFKIKDGKDRHPNEVKVCMSNSETNTCQAIHKDQGSSYSVNFDATLAGEVH